MLVRYAEWRLVKETGLSPAQLEALPAETVLEWLSFLGAEGQAREEVAEQARREAERKARRGR